MATSVCRMPINVSSGRVTPTVGQALSRLRESRRRCLRTWNTKFSLKLGLRSAKLSLLGEHRRWLRSSGRRQTLRGSKEQERERRNESRHQIPSFRGRLPLPHPSYLTYVLFVMPPSFVDLGRFLIFLMSALSDSVA